MTVNVAVVAPAGTVTLGGTCAAAVLLLERVTTEPPAGAGPFNFAVPVDELPPMSEVGLRVMPLPLAAKVGANTVRLAVLVGPYVPEIVTEVLAATGVVVTWNVAVVAPAATVTVAGTCATAVLLLESATTAPPVGAAWSRVTVPVEEAPPVSEVGLSVTLLSPAITVRLVV